MTAGSCIGALLVLALAVVTTTLAFYLVCARFTWALARLFARRFAQDVLPVAEAFESWLRKGD